MMKLAVQTVPESLRVITSSVDVIPSATTSPAAVLQYIETYGVQVQTQTATSPSVVVVSSTTRVAAEEIIEIQWLSIGLGLVLCTIIVLLTLLTRLYLYKK